MVTKVMYEGKEIPLNAISLEWTDCFGETHTGTIENYATDYANECVGEAEAGDGW